jgi:hypothetical protein
MSRLVRWSGAAAVAVSLLASAASAQRPGQQVAQAPAAPAVLGTNQYNENPDLRCDILEVKRASGGALLIRWRMVNTAGAGAGGLTGGGEAKPISYTFKWSDVYYTDPAENKKYTLIIDPSGAHVSGIWEGDLPSGQQRLSWAKFAAPPATSTKISFMTSGFAPFEDLPISQ